MTGSTSSRPFRPVYMKRQKRETNWISSSHQINRIPGKPKIGFQSNTLTELTTDHLLLVVHLVKLHVLPDDVKR